MESDIFVVGIASAFLLFASVKKWAMKGEIIHPGFIYSLINAGFFIVFAFGPYKYIFNLDWSYYYMYGLITYIFVIGIIWGCKRDTNRIVKDINLKPTQLLCIYLLLLVVSFYSLIQLNLLDVPSLEKGVLDRIDSLNTGYTKVNTISYTLTTINISFVIISNALITAFAVYKRRNYDRIVALFLILVIQSIITNSRTGFVISLILILATAYTVLKGQNLLDFSKLQWSKNLKITLPTLVLTIFIMGILTNARSSIIASKYEKPYEYIENYTRLERKPWFNKFVNTQPTSVVNPIAELSIYAGSTVAHGGLITDIAMKSGLRTWGLRSFFSIHRVLSQLKLDAGLSNYARSNYERIIVRATLILPSIESSWWGDPANLIVDFGYLGAPIVALLTGWTIGWLYERVSNSGPIFKSVSCSIILTTIILTPALGPYSNFTNFINMLLIFCYIKLKSVKVNNIVY